MAAIVAVSTLMRYLGETSPVRFRANCKLVGVYPLRKGLRYRPLCDADVKKVIAFYRMKGRG